MALIITNVYNSVKAPAKRGFSFIEIWMVGVQIPIFVAILEYGIILAMKKYQKKIGKNKVIQVSSESQNQTNFDNTIDKWSFICTLVFITIFNIGYWSAVLSVIDH